MAQKQSQRAIFATLRSCMRPILLLLMFDIVKLMLQQLWCS